MRRSCIGAVLVVLAVCRGAHADTPPAEQLFREGRDLIAKGKLAEACQRFEQSLALSDEVGPRMNLALCEEQRGHLVAALSGFEIVADRALATRDLQIADVAGSHIKALRARVATVVARGAVPAGTRLLLRRTNTPDVEIRLDAPIPQDPTHPTTEDRVHVVASACGYRDFESPPVQLAEGAQQEIKIAALEPAAGLFVPPPARPHQTLGYGLLAGGVPILAGSVVYGLWQRDEAREVGCVTDASCVDRHNRNMRVWGSALFATGVTLSAVGIYFAIIQRPRKAPTTAFTPMIGRDTIGLAWGAEL